MTGSAVLYCKWGIETFGEKALYCEKCCCLTVKRFGCMNCFSMAVGSVRNDKATSVVSLFVSYFIHFVNVLFSVWGL